MRHHQQILKTDRFYLRKSRSSSIQGLGEDTSSTGGNGDGNGVAAISMKHSEIFFGGGEEYQKVVKEISE